MNLSTCQRGQNLWKLASSPRDRDSLVGNTFCEVEHVNAVMEHRRTRLPEIEPPRIDFPKMGDEFSLEFMIALDQLI